MVGMSFDPQVRHLPLSSHYPQARHYYDCYCCSLQTAVLHHLLHQNPHQHHAQPSNAGLTFVHAVVAAAGDFGPDAPDGAAADVDFDVQPAAAAAGGLAAHLPAPVLLAVAAAAAALPRVLLFLHALV